VTNSPVFPGHVLFSRPVAVLYKVMKMSWFSKNSWERSALQQNIDGQTRSMRKKNRIKRKKTKDMNIFSFCKFVRAVFVQFGGISFIISFFIF